MKTERTLFAQLPTGYDEVVAARPAAGAAREASGRCYCCLGVPSRTNATECPNGLNPGVVWLNREPPITNPDCCAATY